MPLLNEEIIKRVSEQVSGQLLKVMVLLPCDIFFTPPAGN